MKAGTFFHESHNKCMRFESPFTEPYLLATSDQVTYVRHYHTTQDLTSCRRTLPKCVPTVGEQDQHQTLIGSNRHSLIQHNIRDHIACSTVGEYCHWGGDTMMVQKSTRITMTLTVCWTIL